MVRSLMVHPTPDISDGLNPPASPPGGGPALCPQVGAPQGSSSGYQELPEGGGKEERERSLANISLHSSARRWDGMFAGIRLSKLLNE